MATATVEQTITCPHCKGEGHHDCKLCMAPRNGTPGIDFRDEMDTGRQNEGDCYMCNGRGKILSNGQAIED